MFTQKVDKCPNASAYCPIAVVNSAERHLYWQAFIRQQFDQFTSCDLLINHII